MKISTLVYSVRQGLKNIRRNLLFSLASIGTIVACIFLFGVFYAIVQNVKLTVRSIEDSLTVSVFFDEGLTDEQVLEIGEKLQEIHNIASIEYISSDKAWEAYVQEMYHGDMEYVNSVFGDDNPLANSASFELTFRDIGEQAQTVEQVKSIAGVRKVNSSDSVAKSVSSLNRLVGYASVSVILILLLVSLFLISNTITIGISVRKEEIAIMKLIGATDLFVRAPFLIEGMMLGLVGSLLPLAGLYFLYNGVTKYLMEHFLIVENMMRFAPVGDIFARLVPISILFGVGVGFLGSFVTTHKHLNV